MGPAGPVTIALSTSKTHQNVHVTLLSPGFGKGGGRPTPTQPWNFEKGIAHGKANWNITGFPKAHTNYKGI